MEHINYQLVNNQKFSGFVTDPAGINSGDEKSIAFLLEKFPYSQILHTLHAKSFDQGTPEFNEHLAKAALYSPDRNTLFNAVNNPDYFKHTPQTTSLENSKPQTEETDPAVAQDEELEEELAAIDVPDEDITIERTKETESESVDFEEEILPEEPSDLKAPEDNTAPETQPIEEPTNELVQAEEQPTEESPGSAGLGVEPTDMAAELDDLPVIEPEIAEMAEEAEAPAKTDETEKLIIGNIAATDYFRFEQKLDDQKPSQPAAEMEYAIKAIEEQENLPEPATTVSPSTKEISKYNDDKMPYTFLWWLSKTRKEHSDTYQPYANFKPDTTRDIKKNSGEELNQQIIENIFHLQSPLEDVKEGQSAKTVQFELKKKEEAIIERFIKEEPQIRPPKPEKLDTENKARKSSEDTNDVVSETLAQIYIEQMLFHKAIETYRKLSLKFPEKSAYFADQINKLENR